jgi:hypothetical protein
MIPSSTIDFDVVEATSLGVIYSRDFVLYVLYVELYQSPKPLLRINYL